MFREESTLLDEGFWEVSLIGWLKAVANFAASVTRTTLQCGLVLAKWEGKKKP